MTKIFTTTLAIALVSLAGCRNSQPENTTAAAGTDPTNVVPARPVPAADPQQNPTLSSVDQMIVLLKTRDYRRLLTEFYGDKERIDTSEKFDRMVQLFEQSVGDKMLRALENSRAGNVEVSPDGNSAEYPMPGGKFRMIKQPDGKWLFYL